VQFNVLRILVDHADDGVRQKDVERWLATSSANLSTVVDRMVPLLVERVESTRDRRSKDLSITARGRDVLQAAEHDYGRLLGAIYQQLDDAHVRAAYEFELRIQNAMEAVLADATTAAARSNKESTS
jgi:DNA-binding MarR family transcriptional regulator